LDFVFWKLEFYNALPLNIHLLLNFKSSLREDLDGLNVTPVIVNVTNEVDKFSCKEDFDVNKFQIKNFILSRRQYAY